MAAMAKHSQYVCPRIILPLAFRYYSYTARGAIKRGTRQNIYGV
jgi:hypothetical protein